MASQDSWDGIYSFSDKGRVPYTLIQKADLRMITLLSHAYILIYSLNMQNVYLAKYLKLAQL